MPGIREFYDRDLRADVHYSDSHTIKSDRVLGTFECLLSASLEYNVLALKVFLPQALCSTESCRAILNNLSALLKPDLSMQFAMKSGERLIDFSDLLFAGRVYFYCETDIDPAALDDLIVEAKSFKLSLVFRGSEYAAKQSMAENPLAFISHDFRDKDGIARPLAQALVSLACPVWFDEFSMHPGDSLRESIEKGLRECKKCILVITPNFLSNSGWIKTEYTSVFTRELLDQNRVLIPIWSNVDKRQVYEFSPMLADRLAILHNPTVDIETIASKIRELLFKG